MKWFPMLSTRAILMVSTVCAITFNLGMEVQSLPMSFRAMEVDMNVAAASLSWLSVYETLAFMLAVPIFLNLVECGMPRKRLLLIGTASWAVCTLLLAFVELFSLTVLLRFASGISLAVVWPVMQASVLEHTEAASRGFVFGLFYFSFSIGQVFSCLFFLPISERVVCGMPGWRFALLCVACLRILVAFAAKFTIPEDVESIWSPERFDVLKDVRRVGNLLLIPSFNILVLQAIASYAASSSAQQIVVFMQYDLLPDHICAYINTFYIFGSGAGSVFGGLIGDRLYTYSPKYGRAVTGQLSLLLYMSFTVLLFAVNPDTSDGIVYGLLNFMAGFSNFSLTAAVSPIIADVIKDFTYGFLCYIAFGLIVGYSIGNALLTGLLSARGYEASTSVVSAMEPSRRVANLTAMRTVIPAIICVSSVIVVFIFGALYFTYEQDRIALLQVEGGTLDIDKEKSTYGSTEEGLHGSRKV